MVQWTGKPLLDKEKWWEQNKQESMTTVGVGDASNREDPYLHNMRY